MRWALGFVLLAVIALLNAVSTENELQSKDATIFERTFKTLHGEPPPPEPVSRNRANIQYLWIEQKLDHFNDTETRSWQMRYMTNDEFYQEGAPFFIFVGGEWEISTRFIDGGHFYDLAKEHNGYLFYTEHRYYGQSRPTSNIDNENIKYLHVRQALADLAHFIEEMRATVPGASYSKVILAGGSYSATMVTWFKKLYPELAIGVWASSAPLLAKLDFVEYKEITGQSIRLLGGEQCYTRIEKGIAEMEALFANKRGAEVKALLKLCNAFDEYNDLDLWTLFNEIGEVFAGVVQTHNSGQIESVCSKIMEGEDDISGVAGYLLTQFNSTSCNLLTYKAIIATMMDSSFTDNIMRAWIYQTCNEYGWYQTSGSTAQPFGTKFPLTLFTQMCKDIYGDQFTNEFISNQVAATNELFGGLEPNVENVYFTHGQLDPWRAMGSQDGAQVTILPLYAHCKDFDSISDKDSDELKASKTNLADLVRQWLGSSNATNSAINKAESF
ncbi:putative serine protease K12H4.7 [Anastrepha obliqua]|uniref:putative serine protease K12H4.7 n=1 Tax=Anastrepha obliqua TaxID=95512 RepID=UPI00240968D4|nr:putative serine protease K12H4.7 [Anastrepha obliqua]